MPFVYALRGDRNWKHAPGTEGANRVSPLVAEVWGLVEKRAGLAATEIREELGRELTEAAVLRALHELWASLRVIPIYQAGGRETLWEPLQSRHKKAVTSGAGMSQVTALSVLVSVYLQSAVAASGDDVEAFLSPLTSRSKVREAVRGLTATRQLGLIQMETQSLLHVEGSLPEFPAEEKPLAEAGSRPTVRRPHPTSPEAIAASLRGEASGSAARPAYKRPASFAGKAIALRPPMRTSGGGSSPSAARRAAGGGGPDSRGGIRDARSGARPAFGAKGAPKGVSRSVPRSFSGEKSVARREPGTGLRADGTPKKTRWRDLPGGRPDQKGKPARFGPRREGGAATERPTRLSPEKLRPAAGAKVPYKRTSSQGGGKPFRPGGPNRPASRSAESARPSSRPYSGAARPSSGSRPSGGFAPRREGSRPFSGTRREGDAPASTGSRGPSNPRKYTPRPSSGVPAKSGGGYASRRSSVPGAGSSRPFSPRAGGPPSGGRRTSPGRPPFGKAPGAKAGGGRSYGSRPVGTGGSYGARPAGGRPSGPRPGFGQGPRPGTGRPRPGGFKPGGKPGGRPPTGKFKKRSESAE
jgi:hypothetical protein